MYGRYLKLPQIGPRLRLVLQLGAALALLAFLISRLDWQRSLTLIRGAEPLLLATVVLIQMADRVLMALKWHQLLRVLDERLGRWGAIRVYYESTFIGFALPLGGLGPDIVRFVRLRSQGIDPHVTLASMVMERLNGVLATLALVVVGGYVLLKPELRITARANQAMRPPTASTKTRMITRAAQMRSSGAAVHSPSTGSATPPSRHASQIAASQAASATASFVNPRQKPKAADARHVAMMR